MTKTYQVTTSYFCCGIIVQDGKVLRAAPIMKWAVEKDFDFVKYWVVKKGGTIELLP